MPLKQGFDALVYHFAQVRHSSLLSRRRVELHAPRQHKKCSYDVLTEPFQSTVEFNPGFDPSQRTPEETQFVNLLKSKWLLDKMEQSSHLSAAGTPPLWTSALAELKSVCGRRVYVPTIC